MVSGSVGVGPHYRFVIVILRVETAVDIYEGAHGGRAVGFALDEGAGGGRLGVGGRNVGYDGEQDGDGEN